MIRIAPRALLLCLPLLLGGCGCQFFCTPPKCDFTSQGKLTGCRIELMRAKF